MARIPSSIPPVTSKLPAFRASCTSRSCPKPVGWRSSIAPLTWSFAAGTTTGQTSDHAPVRRYRLLCGLFRLLVRCVKGHMNR